MKRASAAIGHIPLFGWRFRVYNEWDVDVNPDSPDYSPE